jgi:tetratricopeptide (TPR) repeat protein
MKDAATRFDQLFAAYAAGDRTVVITQLKSGQDCARIQPALETSTKSLLAGSWQRDKAAFVLELANDLSQCALRESYSLISQGRNYVMGRPTALGADQAEDAFELAWHLIAVAVLQRERATYASEVYLDTLERRYVTGAAAKAARTTLDPRFRLMRAIGEEQRSLVARVAPRLTAQAQRRTDASVQSLEDTEAVVPATPVVTYPSAASLRTAAKLFERSAADAAAAPESYVRLASVRFRLGEFAPALTAIERARVMPEDRPLRYWAGLWRGRILDALHRTADAERAYADALDAWPTGQSAGVGLALMRFKLNRRADAVEAAARVQAVSSTAPDPWWTYYAGLARFIPVWLGQMRETLR